MSEGEARKFRREDGSGEYQRVLIQMILDESGSMDSRRSDVIGGFNSYIKELKEDQNTDYFISLTKFNTNVNLVYARTPLSQVNELTNKTYKPKGGTALYDAVGETCAAANVADVSKTIVVIMTDGQENSSRQFRYDQIKDLMAEKEKESQQDGTVGWTFVFMGDEMAVVDANPIMGAGAGAYAGNTVAYRGNAQNAYNQLGVRTMAFAASPLRMNVNFMAKLSEEDDGLDRIGSTAVGGIGGTSTSSLVTPTSTTGKGEGN